MNSLLFAVLFFAPSFLLFKVVPVSAQEEKIVNPYTEELENSIISDGEDDIIITDESMPIERKIEDSDGEMSTTDNPTKFLKYDIDLDLKESIYNKKLDECKEKIDSYKSFFPKNLNVCPAAFCIKNANKNYLELLEKHYPELDDKKSRIADTLAACYCRCPLMNCEMEFFDKDNTESCKKANMDYCYISNKHMVNECVRFAEKIPKVYDINIDEKGFKNLCEVCNEPSYTYNILNKNNDSAENLPMESNLEEIENSQEFTNLQELNKDLADSRTDQENEDLEVLEGSEDLVENVDSEKKEDLGLSEDDENTEIENTENENTENVNSDNEETSDVQKSENDQTSENKNNTDEAAKELNIPSGETIRKNQESTTSIGGIDSMFMSCISIIPFVIITTIFVY